MREICPSSVRKAIQYQHHSMQLQVGLVSKRGMKSGGTCPRVDGGESLAAHGVYELQNDQGYIQTDSAGPNINQHPDSKLQLTFPLMRSLVTRGTGTLVWPCLWEPPEAKALPATEVEQARQRDGLDFLHEASILAPCSRCFCTQSTGPDNMVRNAAMRMALSRVQPFFRDSRRLFWARRRRVHHRENRIRDGVPDTLRD
jgi:hypothetical protein